jgi:imidazolonepropionase-like amidohydrolase/Tol biopolymer transport system component
MRMRHSMCALCFIACASPAPRPSGFVQQAVPLDVTDTISFETTEATRLAFDIAADGGSIVIDLLGQLWRVPAIGGEAVPITNAVRDTSEDFDPVISPDGRRIVFESDRPGGRASWIMPAGGGRVRKLTSRQVVYFAYPAPSWSPDGRRIAYSIGDTLAVLDVDSGAETVPRLDSLPTGFRASAIMPRNSSPIWSPDGKRLLFVNTASTANRGEGRIWEVAVEGGTARPITAMRGLAPVRSPDGTQLAFFARDSANRWQVWLQARDGAPRRLTNHDEVITYRARWMPDGRAIVYSADGKLWRVSPTGGSPQAIPFHARVTMPRRRVALKPATFANPGEERVAKGLSSVALSFDGHRIAIIALDTLWIGDVGAQPRAVSPAAHAGDNALTWSPDGRAIAWTRSERADGTFNLVVTDARSGASRAIADVGADVYRPTWSPDGRWIAFIAGDHLRAVDPAKPDSIRDLGVASSAWGTLSWTSGSDAVVVAAMDLGQRRSVAQWVPLTGERRKIETFPRGPADLHFYPDGHAAWVENDLLWRAQFDGPAGVRNQPAPVSDEAAVEARYARDGSILYISTDGLRLRAPSGDVRRIGWPLRYRAAAAPATLLIRGARVLDGRGSPLSEARDVLLQNSRIARIAPVNTIPANGVRTIDASGAYLVPGFIDLHAHIWSELSLLSWLHSGVTTVRDIASQQLKTADTRNTIDAGIQDGPRIVYGGAMFHRFDAGFSTITDQMVTDSGAIARAVAIQAGMDARFVKERGFQDWWSAVRLVDEAHRHGLTVSGHCEHILPVVAAGMDGAEHVLDCFRDRSTMRADYAELARAAGMFIVPTAALRFSMLQAIDDSALVHSSDVAPFLPLATKSIYTSDSVARRGRAAHAVVVDRLERSVRRYRQAGVLLATGTDSPFPLGIHHEMEVLVASGLAPMDALVAATGGAARVLNAPEIGTIVEGQWADVLLLDANPLDDIRNTRKIREVIQRGRIIDRARLRQLGVR